MEKTRAQKLRRKLGRLGYSLYKRGRGDNFGYMIIDEKCHAVAAGDFGIGGFFGLTLDEVEDWLNQE